MSDKFDVLNWRSIFSTGTDWNLYPLSSTHRLVWHIFEESFDESYIPEYAAILQQHRRLGENPVDVLRSFEVMQGSKTVAVEQNKATSFLKLCWSSPAGLKESLLYPVDQILLDYF